MVANVFERQKTVTNVPHTRIWQHEWAGDSWTRTPDPAIQWVGDTCTGTQHTPWLRDQQKIVHLPEVK